MTRLHDRLKAAFRRFECSDIARRDHRHGFEHEAADLADVAEEALRDAPPDELIEALDPEES